MTGEELHQLLLDKWGCSYDVQVRKSQGKILVQIMWKYLQQASFPLSPDEYMAHLNTIALYINGWGATEQLTSYIAQTQDRPRLGRALTLIVDLGDRSSEWMVDDR
ncbi:DUF3067 family protein [Roseofilum casamattae]|uniref:DUF3067 family protein n=1 Tax=Roseofilum casamattae BLCC-M143 TaxID=3022442 RepID=A0ABT7BYK7_9CYAN|nr:DUF3067 family protein [Roseofilum casamattae]MDJ1184284.1 DUF3067 family protein [Roseofilum casamattae BLCC-M143]